MLSGDPRAGEFLGSLQRDTTMLFFDGIDTCYFWPFFQRFLMWELNKKFTDVEQRILYSRGALYYELAGEMDKALEYYSLANEQSKVSAMLIKNPEKNPSLGCYREMKSYYFSLPSIMNGGKDFCEWSKKDDFLYATMRKPVEAILGRDGVGLGDCGICESKFEKGTNLWIQGRIVFLPNIDAMVCRIQLLLGEGEYDDALLLLAKLLPYCQHCERVMDGIHIRLLGARCHERLGNEVWKDELQVVLDTCYKYRFIWPVAQYGMAILPLLGKCKWEKDLAYFEELTTAVRVQAAQYPRFLKQQRQPMNSLSGAELQVLKLLCENLSNREIGEILGIKLSTVKTHVSRILHKLGISRRSEAKAVAEERHLR